ncbi:prestin-like [Littorina saxatilis]|uniref:prestin-like n=1 Tax=Littorina saxatilis TaxID=31220 RepID=UPI0038B5E7BB
MILSIVISKYCDLRNEYSLKIVGNIPTGLPEPTFPDLSLAKSSISDAIIIGVVAFAQSVALAKTFAIKNGYKIDANQEMFSYGVCSCVSSLFSGTVAAASMARTIVQDGTGGVSQIASLIGCVIVLMVILFLGPLFYYLPFCILSSVIIVNLRGMFRQFLLLKPYWKQSKPDMVLFLATFLAVVVIDVDIGLGVGVAVAVFSVVIRTQRADFSELGQVDDLGVFKPLTAYDKTFTNSTTRVLRFSSPLYFANSEQFQNCIPKLLGIDISKLKKQKLSKNDDIPMTTSSPQGGKDNGTFQNDDAGSEAWSTASPSNLRHVILDLSGTTFMDTMGATALKKVILDLEIVDIYLYAVGLPETSYHVLKTTDVWEKCSDHFYVSMKYVLDDVSTVSVHL